MIRSFGNDATERLWSRHRSKELDPRIERVALRKLASPQIEANVVRGRTITSWPSLHTDLRHAGAIWVDEEVVVCTAGPNTIVSSRKPDDLDAFVREMISAFASA